MATDSKDNILTALQLVGSPTSQFYFELSLLYARPVICPPGFRLLFLVAYPSGEWSLGETPDAPERRSLPEILAALPAVDLVVPHLFCPDGLTAYRSFFERVLGLPLVGSPGAVLEVAQRKQLTRLVAKSAGIRVPKGDLIRTGEDDRARTLARELGYPVIVKPDETDNSDGLSLVRDGADLAGALVRGREFNSEVLIEEYIPGREIRGAVLELDGELTVLPFIEYLVSEEHPIRLAADKLTTAADGTVTGQSNKENVPAVCPADLDDRLTAELGRMMQRMHRLLRCRDYSLYDFRVDERTGIPYLLEAGLFWSFGEISMISSMLRAGGFDLTDVTGRIWRSATG